MRVLGCLIVLLAVLVAAAPAPGQCRISYGSYQPYYAPTYQTYTPPTYYAPPYQQATVLVGVPLVATGIGVGYNSGYVNNDDIRALSDRLAKSEQRSDLLMQMLMSNRPQDSKPLLPARQQEPPQQPQQQQQSKAPLNGIHPGVAVAAQKCASCHDAATKQKGGGVMLTTAGQRATISDSVYKALARVVIKGTMPPVSTGVKLADDEGTALLDAYAQ